MYTSIQNGTHSAWRKPFMGKPIKWICSACGAKNPGLWGTCKECNEPRGSHSE